jgi:hypothetical protein
MLAGAVLIVFALTVWLFTPKQSTRSHQCVIPPHQRRDRTSMKGSP